MIEDTQTTLEEIFDMPPGSFKTFIKAREAASSLRMCRDEVTLTSEQVKALFEYNPDLKEFCNNAIL